VLLLLLCTETVAAATLGWGLALALFLHKRALGAAAAAWSIVYWGLCTWVVIPHFTASGTYERVELFGALGSTMVEVILSPVREPGLFFERLFRRESIYYVLTLLATIGLAPLRGWRIALMCVPTLILVLVLENPEWLTIKFWHQCTILPYLFFAAVMVTSRSEQPEAPAQPDCNARHSPADRATVDSPGGNAPRISRSPAVAAAILTSAALGHYFLGFSPLAKAFEPYAADTRFHLPDRRLELVRRLRTEIPRDRSILATERLAAHFTDYHRLYTARRDGAVDAAHFIAIDAADTWDTSGLPQQTDRFTNNPCFHLLVRDTTISVFARSAECPIIALD
jgi:uncharacterized membrane protein